MRKRKVEREKKWPYPNFSYMQRTAKYGVIIRARFNKFYNSRNIIALTSSNILKIMKKQSILRLMIAAMIVSAAIFVMAATHARHQSASTGKEDCTAEKTCEQQPQSEFFLGTLAKNLLGK